MFYLGLKAYANIGYILHYKVYLIRTKSDPK